MCAENLNMTELCKPRQFVAGKQQNPPISATEFFALPKYITEMLEALRQAYTSILFTYYWQEFARQAHKNQEIRLQRRHPLSLETVIENVWKPTYGRYGKHIVHMELCMLDLNSCYLYSGDHHEI